MRKKLIVIIIIITVLVILLSVFRDSSTITQKMYVSDSIATNISDLDYRNGTYRFFTGSGIAEITKINPFTTKKTTPIIPIENVIKTRWTKDGILLKLSRLEEGSYLDTITLVKYSDQLRKSSSWWFLNNSGIKVVDTPSIFPTDISDMYVGDDDITALSVGSTETEAYKIVLMSSLETNSVVFETGEEFDLPTIIGIKDRDTIIINSINKLSLVSKSDQKNFPGLYQKAFYDSNNNKLVALKVSEENKKQDQNTEESDHEESSTKIGYLDMDKLDFREITKNEVDKIILSNSNLIIKNQNNKDIIDLISQTNSIKTQIEVTDPRDLLSSSIESIVPGPEKDSMLLTDNFNQLYYMGVSEEFANQLPQVSYVGLFDESAIPIEVMTAEYDSANNTAVVAFVASSDPILDQIARNQDSINKIFRDINQVNIKWTIFESSHYDYDE